MSHEPRTVGRKRYEVFSHPIPLIDQADDGYVEQQAWIEVTDGITKENAHEKLVAYIGDGAFDGVQPTGVVTGPHHLVPLLWDNELDREVVVLPGSRLTIGEEESIRWRPLEDWPAAAYAAPFWKIEYEDATEIGR